MTASDDSRLQSADNRADAGTGREEDADDDPEAGRYDKYVEYLLDLLSFL